MVDTSESMPELPLDLLLKIACGIDANERAGSLSLVSKAFKGACEDAQLIETSMTVSRPCFASFQSYLPWFKRYTSQLKTLNIQSSSSVSFLAQNENEKLAALLEATSSQREGLQHLTLSQPREGWQQTLSCLCHLQSLHVCNWYVPWPGGCESQVGCLASLSSLQEIVWEDINKGGHDPYFSFGTLMGPFQPASQLTRLSLRNVTLQHKLYFLTSFLADVISLTGLRHLELIGGNAHIFSSVLHLLTGLESLVLETSAPCKCNFSFLAALDNLTSLHLTVKMPEGSSMSLDSLCLPFAQLKRIKVLRLNLPKGLHCFSNKALACDVFLSAETLECLFDEASQYHMTMFCVQRSTDEEVSA